MIGPLSIVTAGAGSGKTHTIQEQLGTWVADGIVAPERILAVTYTEAAAAELRERISAGLLRKGLIEEALRLSQAYISTIHALGLRILTEFAFEAGSSPRPRLLTDDEQNALIRRALAGTDKADRIVADLRSYGYRPNAGMATSAEQAFRNALLEAVDLLRSIGATTPRRVSRLVARAQKAIATEYGRAHRESGQTRSLRNRVRKLLDAFPDPMDRSFGTSQSAVTQFRKDFRNLIRAAATGTLESDWDLWEALRNLRIANRGMPLPEQYVDLAGQVREAADALKNHVGPMEHAQEHAGALLAAAQDVVAQYDRVKRQAGLVDYTDMIAASRRLLTERPEVLTTLANRIDCLVVDEFQDTNPLQFDLLWQIKQAGIPTLVVGDLKQAIMGFQGADPRLFDALERNHREASRPLTRNWRSQPPLMDFINAVGPQLFGDAYVRLEPQRKPSGMPALEVVEFEGRAKKNWHVIRAHAVGLRLQRLLADASQTVTDHNTGADRRLRGSDIAVLCPTNSTLAEYSAVFRALGLQVNHQTSGWLSSRAVQLASDALNFVADPTDRHAALALSATELGSLSLEEGVRQLIDSGRIDDPLLRRLEALSDGATDRTVHGLVADTVSAMGLFDEISSWPDGEQARANLIRLLGEAAEFMDASREALAQGGFHGYGVETFLGWLATRADADEQPDKSVLLEDAITLRTWHSAKGLEWPVVAVCNLDRAIKPRLPKLNVEYDSFEDLGGLLRDARIEYWPKYAASEKAEWQMLSLRKGVRTESKRLLYVALTRARDKLLLEWPSYQGRSQRSQSDSYWKLLRESWSLDSDSGILQVGDWRFPCEAGTGAKELPAGFDLELAAPAATLPVTGRRAIRKAEVPQERTPDSVSASNLAGRDNGGPPGNLQQWRYGKGLAVEADIGSAELGTFLHRCFEVLGARPELAGRTPTLSLSGLPAGTEVRIASAVAQFEEWLRKQFEVVSVMREWPVLALDANETVVSGEADLIVETREGVWVLDHKSDRVDEPAETFRKYQPQLAAYARALAGEGRTVLGFGLNLIRAGQVVCLRTELSPAESRQAGVTGRAHSEP